MRGRKTLKSGVGVLVGVFVRVGVGVLVGVCVRVGVGVLVDVVGGDSVVKSQTGPGLGPLSPFATTFQ